MAHRHILEIETDTDTDSQYLVDVIMWGLDHHNDAVARLEGKMPLEDDFIDPESISILEKAPRRMRRWFTETRVVTMLSLGMMSAVGYMIGVQL